MKPSAAIREDHFHLMQHGFHHGLFSVKILNISLGIVAALANIYHTCEGIIEELFAAGALEAK